MTQEPVPQALDIEMQVLGACFHDSAVIDKLVMLNTNEQSFYSSVHQEIYLIMAALVEDGKEIETVTVGQELKKRDPSLGASESYMVELFNSVSSAAYVEQHALILKEKQIMREMIRLGDAMLKAGYDESRDPLEVLADTQIALDNIGASLIRNKPQKLGTLIPDVIDTLEDIRTGERKTFGLSSGFPQLDKFTGGFEPGAVYIFASRTSQGKTGLALSTALNMTDEIPMVLFSLEMNKEAIATRALSRTSGIDNYQLRNGKYDEVRVADIVRAGDTLSSKQLWIVDQPAMTMSEIRSFTKQLMKQKGIKGIIVDYLQLMDSPPNKDTTREREISRISQGLKTLAKELNVFVIALSQLSRETEKRKDRQPQLQDLRESGAIEQDADAVFLIWRPDHYGIDKFTDDGFPGETKGKARIILAKQRNGPVGWFDLVFVEHTASFENEKVDRTSNDNNCSI